MRTKYKGRSAVRLKCGNSVTDGSWAKDLGVDVIVARCRAGVPLKACQVAHGGLTYGDATRIPTDPEQGLALVNAIRDRYESLPDGVKARLSLADIQSMTNSNDWSMLDAAIQSAAAEMVSASPDNSPTPKEENK